MQTSSHPLQSSVEIKQAQIVTLSPPYTVKASSNAQALESQASYYTCQVLAAVPTSVDHYRLTIRPASGPDLPPEVDLLLLGDHQPARRKSPRRMSPEGEGASRGGDGDGDHTAGGGEDDDDEYDSDSTLNRIALPSQVLDLQMGTLGKRAMAIHVAAHTNDRTIWAYSLDDEEGPLIARELCFSDARLRGAEGADTMIGEELRTVLRTHACRVTFDEISGRVIVGADCEELLVFQY